MRDVDVKKIRCVRDWEEGSITDRNWEKYGPSPERCCFEKFLAFLSRFKQVKCCIMWVRWWNKSTMKDSSTSIQVRNIFQSMQYYYNLKSMRYCIDYTNCLMNLKFCHKFKSWLPHCSTGQAQAEETVTAWLVSRFTHPMLLNTSLVTKSQKGTSFQTRSERQLPCHHVSVSADAIHRLLEVNGYEF